MIEDVINLTLKNISIKDDDDYLAGDEDVMTDSDYDREGKSLGEQIGEILEKLINIEKRVAIIESKVG